MKKNIIAAICGIVALVCIAVAAFSMGVREGIRHAIEDSRIDAEDSVVFIDLDGQVYEHYID